jgi:hypothetical protein
MAYSFLTYVLSPVRLTSGAGVVRSAGPYSPPAAELP